MSRSHKAKKHIYKCGSTNCSMCRASKQHKNVKQQPPELDRVKSAAERRAVWDWLRGAS